MHQVLWSRGGTEEGERSGRSQKLLRGLAWIFLAGYILRHRETLDVMPEGEKTSPDIPPVQETSLLLCGMCNEDVQSPPELCPASPACDQEAARLPRAELSAEGVWG